MTWQSPPRSRRRRPFIFVLALVLVACGIWRQFGARSIYSDSDVARDNVNNDDRIRVSEQEELDSGASVNVEALEEARKLHVAPETNGSKQPTEPLQSVLLQEKVTPNIRADRLHSSLTPRLQKFAPLVLTECSDTTPKHYAPCLATTHPNAVAAEELIYSGFTFTPPIFAASRLDDSEKWWNMTLADTHSRARRAGARLAYFEQHGQTMVFENVTLSKTVVFDVWTEGICMSGAGSTSDIIPSSEPPTHDSVVLDNVPDSWSFQHFVDRASHVVAQVRSFNVRYILTGSKEQESVRSLLNLMGFPPERHLHYGPPFVASRLFWSCRAPLIHPWMTYQFLDMLGLDPAKAPPVEDRRVIMYMSRSRSLTTNGGRKILNENEFLAQIEKLIEERGQGEKLEIHDPKDFDDMASLTQYFHKNVKAIIGPHGGGLLNHLWTGPDTLVLELQSDTWPAVVFYEGAKVLDQQYAIQMLEAADPEVEDTSMTDIMPDGLIMNDIFTDGTPRTDMMADIPAAIEVLREKLGTRLPRKDKVRLHYGIWEAEELGLAHDE